MATLSKNRHRGSLYSTQSSISEHKAALYRPVLNKPKPKQPRKKTPSPFKMFFKRMLSPPKRKNNNIINNENQHKNQRGSIRYLFGGKKKPEPKNDVVFLDQPLSNFEGDLLQVAEHLRAAPKMNTEQRKDKVKSIQRKATKKSNLGSRISERLRSSFRFTRTLTQKSGSTCDSLSVDEKSESGPTGVRPGLASIFSVKENGVPDPFDTFFDDSMEEPESTHKRDSTFTNLFANSIKRPKKDLMNFTEQEINHTPVSKEASQVTKGRYLEEPSPWDEYITEISRPSQSDAGSGSKGSAAEIKKKKTGRRRRKRRRTAGEGKTASRNAPTLKSRREVGDQAKMGEKAKSKTKKEISSQQLEVKSIVNKPRKSARMSIRNLFQNTLKKKRNTRPPNNSVKSNKFVLADQKKKSMMSKAASSCGGSIIDEEESPWKIKFHATKKKYMFYNSQTNELRQEKPYDFEGSVWVSKFDLSAGKKVWLNIETNETSLIKPPDC